MSWNGKIMSNPTVTATLRRAVIESGMSQGRLAKAAGVSQRLISTFRAGTGISCEAIDKLAAYFRFELKRKTPPR